MSGIWNRIHRALHEASEKEQLLAYVTRAYGEHAADELAPELEKMWNPQGLKALSQQLTGAFSDPKIEDLLKRAMEKAGVDVGGRQGPSTSVVKRGKDGQSTPAASIEPVVGKRGRGRPPGSSSKAAPPTQYKDPAQAKADAEKAAATAAMRPDRAGTQANIPNRPQKTVVPGERPVHDVGTAGQSPGSMPGHTRPVQKQTSQEIQPSTLHKNLDPLKAREKELAHRIQGLQIDPKKNAIEINKLVQQHGDVKQKIDRLTNVGQSGVEDMQKRVDYLTLTYPDSTQGDDLARKLGVPTTKQRSRKVKDPTTGEAQIDPKTGKPKLIQQIWSAEKVAKFMNQEPDLAPGTYDGAPVAGAKPDKAGPWQTGDKLPGPTDKPGYDRSPSPIRKPMMKDPKTGEQSMRPGQFPGQRWKPSGVSQKVAQARADQATGNFKYGSRYTNPAEEGQEVVWDGADWVLPSQWAAKKGEMAASGKLPSGERRPWQSGAQNVQGNTVGTSADRQKAAAANAEPDAKPATGKHRDVKDLVKKAYDA